METRMTACIPNPRQPVQATGPCTPLFAGVGSPLHVPPMAGSHSRTGLFPRDSTLRAGVPAPCSSLPACSRSVPSWGWSAVQQRLKCWEREVLEGVLKQLLNASALSWVTHTPTVQACGWSECRRL